MRDGVLGVDKRLDACVDEKCGRAILLRRIGFVEDGEHFDTALVGVYERLGNRRGPCGALGMSVTS